MGNEKQKQIKTPTEYKYGSVKIVEWDNENNDGKTWNNYEIKVLYLDKKDGEEQWKTTKTYTYMNLLEIEKALAQFFPMKKPMSVHKYEPKK